MTTKSRYFPSAPEFSSMWVASENPNPESQPVMNTAFYGREIVQPWNFIVTNFLPVLGNASRANIFQFNSIFTFGTFCGIDVVKLLDVETKCALVLMMLKRKRHILFSRPTRKAKTSSNIQLKLEQYQKSSKNFDIQR